MLIRPSVRIALPPRGHAPWAYACTLTALAFACGGQGDAGSVEDSPRGAPSTGSTEDGRGAAGPTVAGAATSGANGRDAAVHEPGFTVDEALHGPLDPAEWLPLATYDGRRVTILRELDPTGAKLMRIHTVLAAEEGDGLATAPVSHGPDWRYFDTGFPARVDHWLAGDQHGPVRAWWPTGQPREEGRYDHGARVGLWRRHSRHGQLVEEGSFVGGQRDGVHRTWFGDGQLEEESHYLSGVLHGRQRRFGRHGLPLLDAHYDHGVLSGKWADHYPESGALRLFGEYVAGQKEGTWRTAREDGEGLLLEEVFRAGLRAGRQRTWGPTGQLVAEIEFVHDRPHGPSRSWYADGRPQSEGRFEAGKRVGPWTYWSPDGSVNERWTGTYEDDRRIEAPPVR